MIISACLSLASLFFSNQIEIMAEKVVDDVEIFSTSSDGDTTGNFVLSIGTRFPNECGMKYSFFRLLIFSRLTLFRLGFLKTLYDWGLKVPAVFAYLYLNNYYARIVIQVCIERNFKRF